MNTGGLKPFKNDYHLFVFNGMSKCKFLRSLKFRKSDRNSLKLNQGNLAKEKNLPVQLNPFPSLNVSIGQSNWGK